MRPAVFALIFAAAPALAHDYTDVTVTNFSERGPFTSVVLSNTVKGAQVSCALLDADGNAIAATTAITENLATEVLIQTPDTPIADARCVVSE